MLGIWMVVRLGHYVVDLTVAAMALARAGLSADLMAHSLVL